MQKYYVYVYIDPRNLEEFYYGKGKGSRKEAHLSDEGDSEKASRIREIRKAGLSPIIRVIASGLTQNEASLIETTLIWKLGKFTTNLASGHFSGKFRPHNKLHLELSGFDYQNGLYYYNVGEGPHRNWDDYVKYGFISAGQGERWRDAMIGFKKGDVIVAYLKRRKNVGGYVGIGRITQKAEMIRNVCIGKKRLLDLPLLCKNMDDNMSDPKKSEYVALVQWIKTFPRNHGKWKSRSGLYTTTHVRASLDGQPKTIDFVETEFGVDMRKLIV